MFLHIKLKRWFTSGKDEETPQRTDDCAFFSLQKLKRWNTSRRRRSGYQSQYAFRIRVICLCLKFETIDPAYPRLVGGEAMSLRCHSLKNFLLAWIANGIGNAMA
jgi:hypothetical protein